ncbi:MAG: hypothetical protein CMH57_09850 [Myxococcales bacterium]|nr:hypothetical protein [Myxococcales bacterium]
MEGVEPSCAYMIPEQATLERVEVTSILAGQPVDETLWVYRGWAGIHCMTGQSERLLMLRQVGDVWAVTSCFNLLYAEEHEVPALMTPDRRECVGQVYPTLYTIESLSSEAAQYVGQPDSCGDPIPSQHNMDRCIQSVLSCNRSHGGSR